MHADRRPRLLARNRIKAAIRGFFEERGFVEVEAAALQVSPGNEAHLHAFATELGRPAARRGHSISTPHRSSPCKKLLAAGERRIFDFARVFRNRERSALHHPEFTHARMVPGGGALRGLMQDCAELLALAAETAGVPEMRYRGRAADPFAEPERVTVAEAFDRHAGIDLLGSLAGGGEPDLAKLAEGAVRAGIRVAADDTWSDVFSRVLVERIEPNLGLGRATILYRIPGDRGGARARRRLVTRVSPSASSCMSAASSLRTPSAS